MLATCAVTRGTMARVTGAKIWANSGDSHVIEPPGLWDRLPDDVRESMPRTVKDPSGEFETIFVDGQEFRRELPQPEPGGEPPRKRFTVNARPIDSGEDDFVLRSIAGNDPATRLRDLDAEGVWGEVIYPSLGIW